MLKITITEQPEEGRVFIRLEGQIRGRWVDELRRTCDDGLRLGVDRLVLDLQNVTFIDLAGVALLRTLRHQLYVTNCSLFAAEQLKDLLPSGHMVTS